MKSNFCCLLVLISCATQAFADDPQTYNLWPTTPPGKAVDLPPEADKTKPEDKLIAGRRIIKLGNVSTPQITVYRPPADRCNGTAVIICPGGGHHILAYDLEGTEVAQWLGTLGVTGIVLKYRVPFRDPQRRWLAAVQDAQRAMSLARSNAAKWNLDPDRIGMCGFSAGGETAALTSLYVDDRKYDPIDAVDEVSYRPDFTMLIYPGAIVQKDTSRLREDIQVTQDAPPMFFVHAFDDPVTAHHSLSLATALKTAGASAELHIYESGGHGYGLRKTDAPVTQWTTHAEKWMKQQNLLEQKTNIK
ncbi:alpha/beta hydrolase [Planctomycetes bacterium K23_9]|uniref:Acetylxylan esterase n=1 Tax=Stieleria marina TaxID=1930275 RepID=A0A517NMA0_9BACT|nr:Acetylxylan esterase precursor [Planctomycetes bacterium K23_9]